MLAPFFRRACTRASAVADAGAAASADAAGATAPGSRGARNLRRLAAQGCGAVAPSCASPRGVSLRHAQGRGAILTFCAGAPAPFRRDFSTAVFGVEAHGPAKEQTLFVVGIDEGKFFGQDSAEEALKLLERVVEHNSSYHLLLGLSERDLSQIEADHKVKDRRLTASRSLEGVRHGEIVPIVQAGQIDKNPRHALGRILRTSQNRVAWKLWQTPREAVQLYWAFWRRKNYKNEACYRFWTKYFPLSSHFYFNERAELIAIRAIEHLAAMQARGQGGTSILVVGNDIYSVVAQRIRVMLGVEAQAYQRLGDTEFASHMRKAAVTLTTDVPDLTALIVFVYIGLPILTLQFVILGFQHYMEKLRMGESILGAEHYRE